MGKSINIAGYHDQAPHHEVYLKELDDPSWQTLYQAKKQRTRNDGPPYGQSFMEVFYFCKMKRTKSHGSLSSFFLFL
ncbi:hypothetical protein AKG34_19130 [Peribacillus butanolivorans]|nr:hypothetical protein AKG34_19130 [Peribacillus butanolivorans]